jgi:hypothetical protein
VRRLGRGWSARELPQRHDEHEHEQVNQAIGVLLGAHGWSGAEARERLDCAAGHAYTSRASVARMVMVLNT